MPLHCMQTPWDRANPKYSLLTKLTTDHLISEDQSLASSNFQAVRQRRSSQVRVDQSSGDAELGQSEPDEHVFWLRLHEEGDDFSALEALPFEVPSYAVAELISLKVTYFITSRLCSQS